MEMAIAFAGYGGMIAALLWLGIVPYLQKRKDAENAGEPIPSFSGAYLTNFVIATVTGFISVTMAISGLESSLVGVTSIGIAAGMGFSFTYTVLGISNSRTDAKVEVARLEKELQTLRESLDPNLRPPVPTPTG